MVWGMDNTNKREPIRLPILQKWDCHVCGTCCKEYLVRLSEEEVREIESQKWDKNEELAGYDPIKVKGLIFKNYFLNHRKDGSCVFLDNNNLCKIHKKFGLSGKPLPCQMFPYILVPTGKFWSVGVRFACPSATKNLGAPADEQKEQITRFRDILVKREKFTVSISDHPIKPRLDSNIDVDWDIIYLIRDAIKNILQFSKENIPLGLRRIYGFSKELSKTKLNQLNPEQTIDFLDIFSKMVISEVPVDAYSIQPPGWVDKVLFRQICALFSRKDHGPNKGIAAIGRVSLFRAAVHFARGAGEVPKLNAFTGNITFQQIDQNRLEIDKDCNDLLFRYFFTKIDSLQFFGASSYGMSFWEGLHLLLALYPVVIWVALTINSSDGFYKDLEKSIEIVDDHYGFNKILGSFRQRTSFSLLCRNEGIPKLISWYSRKPVS